MTTASDQTLLHLLFPDPNVDFENPSWHLRDLAESTETAVRTKTTNYGPSELPPIPLDGFQLKTGDTWLKTDGSLNVWDGLCWELWQIDTPGIADEAVTNEKVKSVVSAKVSDATNNPTPNVLVKRDNEGRAQIATPTVANDISNKGYVDTEIQTVRDTYIPRSAAETFLRPPLNLAHGIATLGADGLVPDDQLPFWKDNVETHTNRATFPATGLDDTTYIAADTGLQYRWINGSYIQIQGSTSAHAVAVEFGGTGEVTKAAAIRSLLDNRTLVGDDNSSASGIVDTGLNQAIPLPITTATPSADNTQLTSGTKTLRAVVKTFADNIAHLFANKQNNLNRTIRTNLASDDNATDTGGNLTPGVDGILPVKHGGTGLATISSGSILLGNGTSNPSLLAQSAGASATQRKFIATPASTTAGAPTYQPIVVNDLPSIPATKISEDTTHRFTTDTEKTSWNQASVDANTAITLATINHINIVPLVQSETPGSQYENDLTVWVDMSVRPPVARKWTGSLWVQANDEICAKALELATAAILNGAVCVIESSGGMFFDPETPYSTILTARLFQNGNELDPDGTMFTYQWKCQDKNGVIEPDFGGVGNPFRLGKNITVTDTEVDDKANFIVEVIGIIGINSNWGNVAPGGNSGQTQTLNRTVQVNLSSNSQVTDTGGNILPGVTGTVAITNGGTGATNQATAISNLLNSRTLTGDDNATGTITDNGTNKAIPLPVTIATPTASNIQLTAATHTLRTTIQTVINNIKYLFDTKADLTGATFIGAVRGITPTNAADFTRKDYVDTQISLNLGSGGGSNNSGGSSVVTGSLMDLIQYSFNGIPSAIPEAIPGQLVLDTSTGNLYQIGASN